MTAKQYIRGHEIYYNETKKEWLYCDDDSPASVERPCKRCGHMPLDNGEDWCLGHIPNIKNACCGHGAEEGYFQLENGKTFREEVEFRKPMEFETAYMKIGDYVKIAIRQCLNGKPVSEIAVKCSGEHFDGNKRTMDVICALLNTLYEGYDKYNRIKIIVGDENDQ